MGCGIQYFVPEAEHEKLPFFSEDIYFTADAIIDNREELMDKYNIPVSNVRTHYEVSGNSKGWRVFLSTTYPHTRVP